MSMSRSSLCQELILATLKWTRIIMPALRNLWAELSLSRKLMRCFIGRVSSTLPPCVCVCLCEVLNSEQRKLDRVNLRA